MIQKGLFFLKVAKLNDDCTVSQLVQVGGLKAVYQQQLLLFLLLREATGVHFLKFGRKITFQFHVWSAHTWRALL